MRAAIFHGADRPITVERVQDPSPGPGDLLIEVGFCGICGSDVAMTSGSPFDYPVGQCFGHEFAGTVVDTGAQVSGWRAGDRVACMPNSWCGECEACREGRLILCSAGRPSFGFTEYTSVAAHAAVRLPEALSLADGALIEPIACGLRALRMARLRPGDRVLVLGAGSMALAVIWWARQLGAGSIVVASRSAHRKDVCLAFGADSVHSFDEDEPGALIEALGGSPHVVAECVGKAGILNLAMGHVRVGGTVIGMGMSMAPEPIIPPLLTFKEATMIFPLGYSPAEYAATVQSLAAGQFPGAAMVSHVLPLEELGSAIDEIRSGAGKLKVHIDPRKEAK